jgi:hypothetical protein
MHKTYSWRVAILILLLFSFSVAYILKNQLLFGICDHVYFADTYQGCLDKGSKSVGNPLMCLSFSLLAVSPFLFFVRDEVFLKWLRLSLVWFGTAAFFVILTPEYQSGIFSMMNPTKEGVSVFFAVAFIPLSLATLFWHSRRQASSE